MPRPKTTPPLEVAGARGLLVAAGEELAEHGSAGISLRAVARRAGVSHAAPKYHFGDRAGLLTAVAADGFRTLSDQLRGVVGADPQQRLATLGQVYIDFALTHPALFDLMFRPTELHGDDPALRRAAQEALSTLNAAAGDLSPAETTPGGIPALTIISWALVHGLVTLARTGSLSVAAGTNDPAAAADLAHQLAASFSGYAARPTPP